MMKSTSLKFFKMLFDYNLVLKYTLVFLFNVAFIIVFVNISHNNLYYITINHDQSANVKLPADFLSIGIDTSNIENLHTVDFGDKKFRHLAMLLSPARLRIGGTMSERLIFSEKDLPDSCKTCPLNQQDCTVLEKLCANKFLPYFILTGEKWSQINNFAIATNLKLLFSLNDLLRHDDEWDSTNVEHILEYSIRNGYKNIDWQLGNEPNSFAHVFNITITPEMLARDFEKLRKLLNSYGYNNSYVVGPDTTRPQPNRPQCLQYMIEFLGNGSNFINIRSWHQYYLNSRTATLDEFWDPKTFDLLESQIVAMKNATESYNHIPMWLTETSSSYGGGAVGLSDSFAGSPLWLDKLGLCAKYNITTVIRQSFFGNHYSLVDDNFEPLPDWWVSVLYKRLVGSTVLNFNFISSPHQRVYAHCTNKVYTDDKSAITIFALNLQLTKIRFIVNGTAFRSSDLTVDEFIIRAPFNYRKSKKVLLNGWPLNYDSELSELKPRHQRFSNHISMPPYSIGFWVIKNTLISDCNNV